MLKVSQKGGRIMAVPLSRNEILENLKLLSEWLEVKHPGEQFELIVVGGAAMALEGHKDQTRDVDVLEPGVLPEPLKAGIAYISKAKRISPEWINTDAANIFRKRRRETALPGYFKKTSRTIQFGKNLKVRLLGRQGLIATKLLAATPSFAKHTRDIKNWPQERMRSERLCVLCSAWMIMNRECRTCGSFWMN